MPKSSVTIFYHTISSGVNVENFVESVDKCAFFVVLENFGARHLCFW